MGLFSNLFGSKEPAPPAGQEKEKDKGISFMLLYNKLPSLDAAPLKEALERAFKEEGAQIDGTSDKDTLLISGKIGAEDKLMIASLSFPYPKQVLDTILPVCHFAAAEKQKFSASQAHILISYTSNTTPPHIQYDRLYRAVNCLLQADNNAIGIVNESAMTAHPIGMTEALDGERAALLEGKAMPFMSWFLWTGGCVKYILDEKTIWFVTKGNHAFGLPEFAYKGGYSDGNTTMELFNALFAYMYVYGAKIKAGHTAEIGGRMLKFSEVTQYRELFVGKLGTLVVEG